MQSVNNNLPTLTTNLVSRNQLVFSGDKQSEALDSIMILVGIYSNRFKIQ